ncbi:MAG: hypothetical protein JHC74_03625 [Thermoleophilia bacterium]|nr:hypothetical protein [Thermoleophilia bacterium]
MSSGTQRGAQWALLVTAGLVIVGVFLQVYFIASYVFGAGEDALDAHTGLGGIVHLLEVLAFIAALVAYWKLWAKVAPAFALAVIGTLQLGFADADEWVAGFHGLLALVVLILAHAVVQRTVRDLGLGRHGATPN